MRTSTTVPGPDGLPPEVREKLHAELEPGERIAYAAQPLPRHRVRGGIAATIFGVPWTAFAVFWTVTAAQASVLFALFGLPFVAIGVLLLASPWLAYRGARKSVFAVTQARVIVIESGLKFGATTVKSYHPDALGTVERREHSDGSGDLIFQRTVRDDSEGNRRVDDHGLLGIANVRDVERRVRELVASARRGGG